MFKGKFYIPLLAFIAFACLEPLPDRKNKHSLEKPKSVRVENGVSKHYTKDGKLLNEIEMKNGKRNGLAKSYHKNGNIHQEIYYTDDLKQGEASRYYESGQLYQVTPYEGNLMNGLQIKYNTDGRIISEMPYKMGNACKGLKEYLNDGSLKKKYASIQIKTEDNLRTDAIFLLKLSMSDRVKKVKYYVGQLDSNCLHDDLEAVYFNSKTGMGEISFFVPIGHFVMEQINVVAVYTTTLGNTYVTERKYNVSIENKLL